MFNLLGEYDCKVDAKGRFLFPSGLKKQLEQVLEKGFVVNRNLHQSCLVLYPLSEWEVVSKKLNSLNRLIKKNDVFVRRVMGGATPVSLDGAGRMLLPKPLTDYAGIAKELKVVGSGNVVELWAFDKHKAAMNEDLDMEMLAENVFGEIDSKGDE